jgi:hypothetical protein
MGTAARSNQVERVARGEGGVDVAECGGEAYHLQLRRPQRHEDGHRVICQSPQIHDQWLVRLANNESKNN